MFFAIAALSCSSSVSLAEEPPNYSTRLFDAELTLYELVNFYRQLHDLPAIDPSLGASRSPGGIYTRGSPIRAWMLASGPVPSGLNAWKRSARPHWWYPEYLNCPVDAFETATRTLQQRKLLGDETSLRDWTAAQRTVFENCDAKEGELLLPEPVAADAPAWLRHDRDYQRAAAQFYGGAFRDAADAFDRIGRAKTSPWQPWGAYLAARARLREGITKDNREALQDAKARFERILVDDALTARHAQAYELLRMARIRLDPSAEFAALSARLTEPTPSADLPGVLRDYRALWKRGLGAGASDDMTRWIENVMRVNYAMRLSRREGRLAGVPIRHAGLPIEVGNGVHWQLLSAFREAGGRAISTDMRDWLVAIPSGSAAKPTTELLLARDAQLRAASDEAETRLRALWNSNASANPRDRDILARDLLPHARNVSEFAAFSIETTRWYNDWRSMPNTAPVEFSAPDLRHVNPRPRMRPDALMAVAALPIHTILQLADVDSLPAADRAELARVAWLRAALIDDVALAMAAAKYSLEHYPDAGAAYGIGQYLRSQDVEQRREAVLVAMERDMRLSPIPYRHNQMWWCSADLQQPQPYGHDSGGSVVFELRSIVQPERGRPGWIPNAIDRRGYALPGALGARWRREQHALWRRDNGAVLFSRWAMPDLALPPYTRTKAARLDTVRNALRGGCSPGNPAEDAEWGQLARWAEATWTVAYQPQSMRERLALPPRSWLRWLRYAVAAPDSPTADALLDAAFLTGNAVRDAVGHSDSTD